MKEKKMGLPAGATAATMVYQISADFRPQKSSSLSQTQSHLFSRFFSTGHLQGLVDAYKCFPFFSDLFVFFRKKQTPSQIFFYEKCTERTNKRNPKYLIEH